MRLPCSTRPFDCVDSRIDILLTFSSEETVVEVQPSDDSTDIERTADGIQLVVRSGNLGACINT